MDYTDISVYKHTLSHANSEIKKLTKILQDTYHPANERFALTHRLGKKNKSFHLAAVNLDTKKGFIVGQKKLSYILKTFDENMKDEITYIQKINDDKTKRVDFFCMPQKIFFIVYDVDFNTGYGYVRNSKEIIFNSLEEYAVNLRNLEHEDNGDFLETTFSSYPLDLVPNKNEFLNDITARMTNLDEFFYTNTVAGSIYELLDTYLKIQIRNSKEYQSGDEYFENR